ncbi:MAG: osmotically inducible protein OsmC, partial [bacterium]
KQRNIPVDEIKIREKIIKDPSSGKFTIRTNVKLPASFPEKYRDALVKAAEGCTVKKIVQSCPEFEIVLE